MHIHVHNWSSRQAFKYGSPPWIKLYVDTSEHEKTKGLSNHDLGLLVRLWLLAAKYGNGFDIWSYIKVTSTVRASLARFEDLGLLHIEESSSESEKTEQDREEVELRSTITLVLNLLNGKIGKNYRGDRESSSKDIKARLKEGYTEEQLKMVVEDRCEQWLGDPTMEDFLRPTTLFCKKNFSKYIDDIDASGGLSESRKSIFSREVE